MAIRPATEGVITVAQKFTSETKHKPMSSLDSEILASAVPYVYDDMRGNKWNVFRTEDGWRAAPQRDTYGIKAGAFMLAAFGPVGTSSAAREMVMAIDEQGDIWTKKQKQQEGSGLFLVLLALFVITSKGRR